jgi:hypothetical protein
VKEIDMKSCLKRGNARMWCILAGAFAAAACGGEPGAWEESGADEPVGEAEGEVARDDGTPGDPGGVSGLAVRVVRSSGKYCTGTLVATGISPTARWVVTAAHCAGDDPTAVTVRKQDGTSLSVSEIWTHPLGSAYLGSVFDGPGKVDAKLLKLSANTNASANFRWSSVASASAVDGMTLYVEGYGSDVSGSVALRNGTFTGGLLVSGGKTWDTWLKLNSGTFDTEGGDSGGGSFRLSGDNLFFVGIHETVNKDTGVWAMKSWAQHIIACGGFNINNPSTSYCTPGCPCQAGQGDCDADADCASGLVCDHGVGNIGSGPDYGFPTDYDVCVPATDPPNAASGSCGTVGGCGVWKGDCNSHDECLGDLICLENVGNAIGEEPSVDVCGYPKMPGCPVYDPNDGSRNETGFRCTPECPCDVGEGDCTTDDDCRGMLVCDRGNVGQQYGYVNPDVDVCVMP